MLLRTNKQDQYVFKLEVLFLLFLASPSSGPVVDTAHVPIEILRHELLMTNRTFPLHTLSVLGAAAFVFLLVSALFEDFPAVFACDNFAWVTCPVLLSPEAQSIHQLTCNRYMMKTIDTSVGVQTYL